MAFFNPATARFGTNGPSERWAVITPNDITDIDQPRGLHIGGDGNIVLRDVDGNDETFTVTGGVFYPYAPIRVLATGTTATGIVGIY